jgi:hypothetical protein
MGPGQEKLDALPQSDVWGRLWRQLKPIPSSIILVRRRHYCISSAVQVRGKKESFM